MFGNNRMSSIRRINYKEIWLKQEHGIIRAAQLLKTEKIFGCLRQSLRCHSESFIWGLRSENVASIPATPNAG